MAKWDYKLQLGDVFHNEDMSFEDRRDAIVGRIKATRFYDEDDMELGDVVVDLAEASDADQFDESWDRFYDWADWHSVWVETVKSGMSL